MLFLVPRPYIVSFSPSTNFGIEISDALSYLPPGEAPDGVLATPHGSISSQTKNIQKLISRSKTETQDFYDGI